MTFEQVLPRLLSGCSAVGPMSWAEHQSVHGELPEQDGGRTGGRALIDELERAGLRGRGGAGYPLAIKLRAVAAARSRPVVLANGCEGEPASAKDHLLLERLPHLVLDGAVLAARVLGSREIIVAVEREASEVRRAVRDAIEERPRRRQAGFSTRITEIPAGYVSGQETAVISAIGGGRPRPRLTPPYPSERGVARRPTLVSNVETLAHLALIARHGAAWFRAIGTEEDPGSRLLTISGAVREPGVVEVANGTPMRTVVETCGGPTEPLQGYLLGGYSGAWVGPDSSEVALNEPTLRQQGASLGPGVVIAFPHSACPVAEVARITTWLTEQRAGQCGPCIHGLDAIAGALRQLCEEGDRTGGYSHLKRWCGLITGRGACAMPDGAARFVRSALYLFVADFDDHARHGRCQDCQRAGVLPVFGSGATTVR